MAKRMKVTMPSASTDDTLHRSEKRTRMKRRLLAYDPALDAVLLGSSIPRSNNPEIWPAQPFARVCYKRVL